MGPLESKTAWFCVKHKGIARLILMPITVIACVMSAYLFNLPTAVPVIIAVVLVLFIELFVSSAPMAVMKEALNDFNEGNPYPLLDVTEKLLKYVNGKTQRLAVTIDRCAALSEIGKFESAISGLSGLNIEANTSATVRMKFIYYNNLADAYYSLHSYEKHEIWYKMSEQMYDAIKSAKVKKSLEPTFAISGAQHFISKGEYGKALERLCSITPETDKMRVLVASCSADAYIGLKDFEQAKKALLFVSSYGKEIYSVQHARKLLDAIGKDSAKNEQAVEKQQQI